MLAERLACVVRDDPCFGGAGLASGFWLRMPEREARLLQSVFATLDESFSERALEMVRHLIGPHEISGGGMA